jgi:hypothetical protein
VKRKDDNYKFYDCHYGVIKDGDSVREWARQNVSPALDFCKKMQEVQSGRSKDFHMVARVPMALVEKLIHENKITIKFFNGSKEERAEQRMKLKNIIEKEYPNFMATRKKIKFKG